MEASAVRIRPAAARKPTLKLRSHWQRPGSYPLPLGLAWNFASRRSPFDPVGSIVVGGDPLRSPAEIMASPVRFRCGHSSVDSLARREMALQLVGVSAADRCSRVL